MLQQLLFILGLAYLQSVSFSIISRARNRNSMKYHLVAATASNTIWFMTFRVLVLNKMDWVMFIPYTLGTVLGSMSGAKVSMWIERRLMAASDDHLKRTSPYIAVTSRTMVDGRPQTVTHAIHGPFRNDDEALAHFEKTYDKALFAGVLLQGVTLIL